MPVVLSPSVPPVEGAGLLFMHGGAVGEAAVNVGGGVVEVRGGEGEREDSIISWEGEEERRGSISPEPERGGEKQYSGFLGLSLGEEGRVKLGFDRGNLGGGVSWSALDGGAGFEIWRGGTGSLEK